MHRHTDVFERKFDGFPATIVGGTMPAVDEESITEGIDYGPIIDDIAGSIIDSEKPECGDIQLTGFEGDYTQYGGGQAIFAPLHNVEGSAFDDREFAPPNPAKYYVEVYIDGLLSVEYEDFTYNYDEDPQTFKNIIIPIPSYHEDIEVRARYVSL
jgi:hypothetical protein